MIAKFKRGDGIEFETEVGSASFELMEKDGGFERLDTEPAEKESGRVLVTGKLKNTVSTLTDDPPAVDLKKLNKTQLIEEAAKLGLTIDAKAKNADIIAAIEQARKAAAEAASSEETEDGK